VVSVGSRERAELLGEMLETDGWLIAEASLRQMREALAEGLANGLKLPLEEMRERQLRYRLLGQILSDPLQFFLPE